MVSFYRKPKFKTANKGKRVIVVFGPPACGSSTVVDCVSKASETPNVVVPYIGPESLTQVEEALDLADVVFLDVDGGVFGEEDVQRLVDHRLLHAGVGALVRLYADDDTILERAQDRPDYVTRDDLRAWSRAMPRVEERIREHTLAYFMVPNIDLFEAAKQLALRANLQR